MSRALIAKAQASPWLRHLGLTLTEDQHGICGHLPFRPDLIGNPHLPALHGGVTATCLEAVAALTLGLARKGQGPMPRLIDTTIDYLRPGLARDLQLRARVVRAGRRFASLEAWAWQEDPARRIAEARLHYMIPAD